MGDKRLPRVLAIVYIVEGIAILLAPESMSKFTTRWFVDKPRNMRLGGILAIALGISLALKDQQEQPPQPWYRRCFGA
jgi:uncharacterized protein YjeT (DUF2065 family)